MPINIEREVTLATARLAQETGEPVGVFCQLDPSEDNPDLSRLNEYGVVAHVLKVFDLPDGSHAAFLHADSRVRIIGPAEGDANGAFPMRCAVEMKRDVKPRENDRIFANTIAAVLDMTKSLRSYADDNPEYSMLQIPEDAEPCMMINFLCTQAPVSLTAKMQMIGVGSMRTRAQLLLEALAEREQLMLVTEKIKSNAKANFEQQQRRAFLQNQLAAVRQELYGDEEEEIAALRKRAESVAFTEVAAKHFNHELEKLTRLNQQSPEYNVQYSYLEALLSLPWGVQSKLQTDFAVATDVLDNTHYGLRKVKERVLEQIAVMMNNPNGKSPILCLVGPPGVGKTSLGAAIAAALGRKYERVSLGGLHDEAEIRGHRRTYIGAMPGRIMEAMRRAGTSNPVLLLDEVDKIGNDFKGDPSAALLEVLDPEQNCHFHDNYIDVDYDLSKVLFIATANTLSTLSQPLLDRMEIIELSGYLLEEKVEIARRHILPSLLHNFNIDEDQFSITKEAIAAIIERYTGESGVRQLEKELSTVLRKYLLSVKQGKDFPACVAPEHLDAILGVPRYLRERYEGNDFAGVVTGLAWTAAGGEILFIEAALTRSKGAKLTITGNLGNVMKESATIAMQYVKAHAEEYGINPELFDSYQLHLHVPEGAIPKDGPSAGITMATAIVSAFTQRRIAPRIAMTGEITLRGKVMPVGGIKEKILAAKRAGITDIILSNENRKDITEIEPEYLKGLTFHHVNTVSEVFDIALLPELVPNPVKFTVDKSDK
jgi:ATP-dependent Lon protease